LLLRIDKNREVKFSYVKDKFERMYANMDDDLREIA
jgi:hypothetical protein